MLRLLGAIFVGNQSGHASRRLWHLGVALAVGLAAALLSLTRARRPVSYAPTVNNGPVSQGPNSAVVRQSGRVNGEQHSYGLRRLAGWAAARAVWVLVIAGLGVLSWWVGIGLAHAVNPYSASVSATVISSHTDNSDPLDKQIWIHVSFRTKSGRIVRATIEPATPYGFRIPVRGQKIPIDYNPTVPRQAVYAGPRGDAKDTPWTSPPVAYSWAAVCLSLAVTLLLAGLSRLIGIMRAAQAAGATLVRLRTAENMAHVDQLPESYSLEWRLLQRQPNVAGDVHILGEPAGGRWLIVQLDDGRLIWPASKAMASALLRLPTVQSSPVDSVHLLLARYAQIVDLLDKLPGLIRRRPGAPEAEWWLIATPRPMVKTFVSVHLRRRLAALSSALLRAALLCDDEPDSQSRRTLSDASDECREFAGTLPRRSALAALATIAVVAATSLSIVSPFLLLPHIPLRGRDLGQLILLVLTVMLVIFVIFGLPTLSIFAHSIDFKEALFNPASGNSGRSLGKSIASANTDADVYRLERAAFAAVKLPQPSERGWILWLMIVIYPVAITIFFVYELAGNGIAVGGLIALFAIIGGLIALVAIAVKFYRWQRHVRARQAW